MSIIYAAVCKDGYILSHASFFQGNDLIKFTKDVLERVAPNTKNFVQRSDK